METASNNVGNVWVVCLPQILQHLRLLQKLLLLIKRKLRVTPPHTNAVCARKQKKGKRTQNESEVKTRVGGR